MPEIMILTILLIIVLITVVCVIILQFDSDRKLDSKECSSIYSTILDPMDKVITKTIPKTIYVLWWQGWNQAPELQKRCLQTWITKNPDWNVQALDQFSANKLLNSPPVLMRHMELAHKSDIVRIMLLEKYGGIWVDSTVICNIPLDNWINNVTKEGFFAFAHDKTYMHNYELSNWFLISNPNNYIIRKMKKCLISYWDIKISEPTDYSFFHKIFSKNVQCDPIFNQMWNKVPKLYNSASHCKKSSIIPPVYKCTSGGGTFHCDCKLGQNNDILI